MNIIESESLLLKLFSEFNHGSLEEYLKEDNALIFKFESNGGKREDELFYLKFFEVYFFHLPISIDSVGIKKNRLGLFRDSIDELKSINQEEVKEVIPKSALESGLIDFEDFKCYRFYANSKPTEYYVYCARIEGWTTPMD